MTKEELLEMRTKVIENRERLKILNHHYNEMLTEKHCSTKKNEYSEKIKNSLVYKIMTLVRIVAPLTVGTLLVARLVSVLFYLAFLPVFSILGASFEAIIMPRIVFGKKYKEIKADIEKGFDQKEADELYERVSDARFAYHRLRKEFEEGVLELELDDSDEYMEYLEMVDKAIEEYETSQASIKEEIKDEKILNL